MLAGLCGVGEEEENRHITRALGIPLMNAGACECGTMCDDGMTRFQGQLCSTLLISLPIYLLVYLFVLPIYLFACLYLLYTVTAHRRGDHATVVKELMPRRGEGLR